MTPNAIKFLVMAGAVGLSGLLTACSDLARQGNTPYILVIDSLTATSGSTDATGATLQSDVITEGGFINDTATATLRLIPKNPLTPPAPSDINSVTINRYRVEFERTDGRNTAGVDVPHPFDSAVTVRVLPGSSASVGFEFIRHTAKLEPPLAPLRQTLVIIATIAKVTFFGRDQAGHDVTATGRIGVQFGDFADPE